MQCFGPLIKSIKKAAECAIQTLYCSFGCLRKMQIKTGAKWSASSAMKVCKHFIFTFQFWFLEIIILFFWTEKVIRRTWELFVDTVSTLDGQRNTTQRNAIPSLQSLQSLHCYEGKGILCWRKWKYVHKHRHGCSMIGIWKK